MGGSVLSRHNLGVTEYEAGNMSRAMKHFMIAARAGDDEALNEIREGYLDGHVTKDDFEKALRANKESKDEMKSDQRRLLLSVVVDTFDYHRSCGTRGQLIESYF